MPPSLENTNKKTGFFVFVVLAIIYSGFAYPLAYGRGLWPFNRCWFMFSSDNGYDYELVPTAELANGQPVEVDVKSIFHFPVGDGNRFQETPRYKENMEDMATYLCAMFPLKNVTLTDYSWRRTPGRRIPMREKKKDEVSPTVWVNKMPCNT